jgi:hypothetical protein
MEILGKEDFVEIIAWLPHGKGFVIRDKKRFGDEVLPKYFKKSKFTSFTRKLNRWNFVRVTRGSETGAYYHPLFRKDNHKLCSQMTCISAKSAQQLQPMDPVALGLGAGGSLYPDMSDPAVAQRMQEQRQAFFQHQWQQQQAFMAMMAQQNMNTPQNPEGKEGEEATSESKTGDEEQKQVAQSQENNNAMMAFQQQQQQYYSMFMAQQHNMAAMPGAAPPTSQMPMPIPGTINAAGTAPMDISTMPDATGAAMDTATTDNAANDAANATTKTNGFEVPGGEKVEAATGTGEDANTNGAATPNGLSETEV